MSLKACNRKHERQVVALKEKATLLLGKELLLQIHYLHHRVPSNTEWSGILVYETVEGEVSKPGDFVIKATHLVPMDVGSSGYTEYDFSSDDGYMMEQIAELFDEGRKMGHVHTHHSMGTFFSGTDMSELHDNAPQHNYYLSLIVDYKEPEHWKAKIAICGEITRKGTKKTEGYYKSSGEIKVTRTWAGISGEEIIEEVEDLDEDRDFNDEETIDEVQKVLYTIDCDLEIAEDAKEFVERIDDLNSKKGRNFIRSVASSNGSSSVGRRNYLSHFLDDEDVHQTRINYSPSSTNDDDDEEIATASQRDKGFFTPGKVKPFLSKLLSMNPANREDVASVVGRVNALEEGSIKLLCEMIDDNYMEMVDSHFKIQGDDVDNHAIAMSIRDILSPYEDTSANIAEVLEVTDSYILSKKEVSDSMTKYLTGIDLIEIWD